MDQISEYWKIFINHLIQQIEKKLSQPQLNYNATSTSTAVGFDMKMTLHTTHPHKLNFSNISAVTDPILTKL